VRFCYVVFLFSVNLHLQFCVFFLPATPLFLLLELSIPCDLFAHVSCLQDLVILLYFVLFCEDVNGCAHLYKRKWFRSPDFLLANYCSFVWYNGIHVWLLCIIIDVLCSL
jgi:hypothetical protein